MASDCGITVIEKASEGLRQAVRTPLRDRRQSVAICVERPVAIVWNWRSRSAGFSGRDHLGCADRALRLQAILAFNIHQESPVREMSTKQEEAELWQHGRQPVSLHV